ncbi:MAG: hypothetical protein ACJA1A_003682 [Saprospiraceae bacterium]|jgi:hypothetical protein
MSLFLWKVKEQSFCRLYFRVEYTKIYLTENMNWQCGLIWIFENETLDLLC